MKSLAEMDQQINMKVRAAMSEETRKEADKTFGDAILSSETSTYSFYARYELCGQGFYRWRCGFLGPQANRDGETKTEETNGQAGCADATD
jgi:hypothetical protein